jgi:hypothetical protein
MNFKNASYVQSGAAASGRFLIDTQSLPAYTSLHYTLVLIHEISCLTSPLPGIPAADHESELKE